VAVPDVAVSIPAEVDRRAEAVPRTPGPTTTPTPPIGPTAESPARSSSGSGPIPLSPFAPARTSPRAVSGPAPVRVNGAAPRVAVPDVAVSIPAEVDRRAEAVPRTPGPTTAPPTGSATGRARSGPRRTGTPAVHPESATPVVNVTIGRVEVRQPPPVLQPPTPAAPTPGPRPLSLDEYLERRSGGSE